MSAAGGTRAWRLDPQRSRIGFRARVGVLPFYTRGRFRSADGRLVRDPASDELEASGTVEVASLRSGLGLRDRHLLSADFLDMPAHPRMRFSTTSVRGVSSERYLVDGELTIRGRSEPVSLEVGVSCAAEELELIIRGKVDRRRWGVQKLRADVALVAPNIELDLLLVAVPEGGKAAA